MNEIMEFSEYCNNCALKYVCFYSERLWNLYYELTNVKDIAELRLKMKDENNPAKFKVKIVFEEPCPFFKKSEK